MSTWNKKWIELLRGEDFHIYKINISGFLDFWLNKTVLKLWPRCNERSNCKTLLGVQQITLIIYTYYILYYIIYIIYIQHIRLQEQPICFNLVPNDLELSL